MRFHLTLCTTHPTPVIPINYQYPLSAVIYRIIEQADAAYSTFLHNTGYGKPGSLKKFKLFTFSDIQAPFSIQGDRMVLRSSSILFTVCFHIPDAAENFIRGLFMNQQVEIADKKSRAVFTVQQVEAAADWRSQAVIKNGIAEIILHPVSPVVVGRKNAKNNYDYLSPGDTDFVPLLTNNLIEKYAALHEVTELQRKELTESIYAEPLFYKHPPRSRLIWIKAGTEAETKIRGWDKFRIEVKAPEDVIELAMNSGLGINNSMGMGGVRVK